MHNERICIQSKLFPKQFSLLTVTSANDFSRSFTDIYITLQDLFKTSSSSGLKTYSLSVLSAEYFCHYPNSSHMTHKVGSGLVTGGQCVSLSRLVSITSLEWDEIIIVRSEDGVREMGGERRRQQLGVFRTGRDLDQGINVTRISIVHNFDNRQPTHGKKSYSLLLFLCHFSCERSSSRSY